LRRMCHLDAASLIRAETFEDAPLTAPLECSPFPRGAVRRTEGSGDLPIGLRGSFFRSSIRALPWAKLTYMGLNSFQRSVGLGR